MVLAPHLVLFYQSIRHVMKYIFVIIISFIASIGTLHAQNQKADSIIGDLLNKNDMLTLSKNYPMLENEVHPFLQSMAASLLANSLNKPDVVCSEMENLINKYQNLIDFSTLVSMLYVWANNMQYLGMYKESVDLLNTFLEEIPISNRKDIQSVFSTIMQIGNALKDFPQCKIYYNTKENSILPINLIPVSGYGTLISIPTMINGTQEDFIFDTGAEGNAVSEEFAKKYQIRIIADSITTLGATKLYSKLGLIDSLKIGNIIYQNIPVNILPSSPDDEILKVNAILGLPFLKAIKEVRIYPNDKLLVIPYEQSFNKNMEPNIVLYDNQLCIEAMIGNKNTLLNFDTGSVLSYFNSEFFDKNTDYVKQLGKKTKTIVGGFGSVDSVEVYQIPLQKLKIGNATFENLNLDVRMSNYLTDQRTASVGVLGADMLLKCNEIIINTDKMVVCLFNNNNNANTISHTYVFKIPSLYSLKGNSNNSEYGIPPSASLPLKNPTLFYRLSKKWGNIQKVDYTFDLNTMKWQPYYANTLIRIDK